MLGHDFPHCLDCVFTMNNLEIVAIQHMVFDLGFKVDFIFTPIYDDVDSRDAFIFT